MRLDSDKLAAFIGGQLEVQNELGGNLFRGEIQTAVVKGGDLKVVFTWFAKNDGTLKKPSGGWTMDPDREYNVSLTVYSASEIGDGRIALTAPILGEMAIFFPKDYVGANGEASKLDRARVKPSKGTDGKMFVVTAYHGSAHGDTSTTFLITPDFAEAIAATNDRGLGYHDKFRNSDHGFSIDCLEMGKPYPRKAFTSNDGLPVPEGFPIVLFARCRGDRLEFEWRKSVLDRLGLELPEEIIRTGERIRE